jgi:hypothetical protein
MQKLRAQTTPVLLRTLSTEPVSQTRRASISQTDPSSLRDIRLQTQRFGKDRDEQVAKASRALKGIEGARTTRAGVASCQKRVEELAEGLARLKRDNDASACVSSSHFSFPDGAPFFFPCEERERLRQLRESLAARRRTLSAARLVPVPPLDGLMAKETQELHALSTALARARSGLVQELVEVFHVVEVGGRPPIGGKAGTKGEWTIGDLILPVPGDIRRACVVLTCSTTDILVTFQVTPQTISTPSSRTPSISSGYSRFIWASNSLSRRNGREKNLGSVNRGSGLVTAGTLVVGPSMFIPFHFRSACGVYM